MSPCSARDGYTLTSCPRQLLRTRTDVCAYGQGVHEPWQRRDHPSRSLRTACSLWQVVIAASGRLATSMFDSAIHGVRSQPRKGTGVGLTRG